MKVYLGTDHRGFLLKEQLKVWFDGISVHVIDCGAQTHEPGDDFVDIARVVAEKVATTSDARGILLCGSGAGVCIAANKRAGIRAAVGWRTDQVVASRRDDDINILALPADYISEHEAQDLVQAFLQTEFIPEERFVRRIAKIKDLETHA
jgi:ribose 5-phosphate isomerase B